MFLNRNHLSCLSSGDHFFCYDGLLSFGVRSMFHRKYSCIILELYELRRTGVFPNLPCLLINRLRFLSLIQKGMKNLENVWAGE